MLKTIRSYVIIPVIALIAVIAVSSYALAYRGGGGQKGHMFNSTRNQAMQEVIESGDYQAWVELMGEHGGKMMDIITEENFDQYVEMHNLMMDGEFEAAQAIRQELGLEGKGYYGFKKWGMHGGMMKKRLEDKNGDGFCDALDKE